MGTPLQQPPGGQSCSRRGFLPFHHDTAIPEPLTRGEGKDPVSLGRPPLPPAPCSTPLLEGRRRTGPHNSLQSVAAPTTPSWLTPKLFPPRLSPFNDTSAVSPPHVHHTGETRAWRCCREIPGTGPTRVWCLDCWAVCVPARLPPSPGWAHTSGFGAGAAQVWDDATNCPSLSPAAPNLRKSLLISPPAWQGSLQHTQIGAKNKLPNVSTSCPPQGQLWTPTLQGPGGHSTGHSKAQLSPHQPGSRTRCFPLQISVLEKRKSQGEWRAEGISKP